MNSGCFNKEANLCRLALSLVTALVLLNGGALRAAPAQAEPLPFVSPMFGDNMVLQRGKPNPIWDWVKMGGKRRPREASPEVGHRCDSDRPPFSRRQRTIYGT